MVIHTRPALVGNWAEDYCMDTTAATTVVAVMHSAPAAGAEPGQSGFIWPGIPLLIAVLSYNLLILLHLTSVAKCRQLSVSPRRYRHSQANSSASR